MAPEAAVRKEPKKERMPRVDWAKLLQRRGLPQQAWC